MNVQDLEAIAKRVAPTGEISAQDAADVRRAVYAGECQIDVGEAQAMFAIERARKSYCRAWSELFVEALTDFVLNQQPPTGYLSEDNATWLMAEIKRHKQPSSDGDVALVVNLIEKAIEVPPAFSAFAIALVKDAVIYDDTTDAQGRPMGSGRISEADVALLQRILWGAGSEGHLAVSREEADALFSIADATTGADNVQSFEDLFARAVGNYLLGATGRQMPSREDALRWQTAAPAYKLDVLATLSRLLKASPQAADHKFIVEALRDAASLQDDVEREQQRQLAMREAATAAAEVMTPDKAGWLLERIDRNGVMSSAEIALVRFVAREASAIDMSMKAAVEKAR